MGWLSASATFTLVLLLPLLTILDSASGLMSVMGALFLGVALSPEHWLRARASWSPHPRRLV